MTAAIAGIRVLDPGGGFGAPRRVSWAGGVFAFDGEAQETDLDGRGRWLIPGLVDAHAHTAWHAFDERDRAASTPAERDAATLEVLGAMLRAGFTGVRDAGGLDPALLRAPAVGAAQPHGPLPRAQTSVALIDRPAADAAGGVLAAVEGVLAAGARWVKLVGTAGVASPAGAGLEPMFTAEEQRAVAARAREVGAGVMLHAWGGSAIDDAIEAGAASIEHGIFLTDAQARRAAERGMTLVPTLRIYRLVQRMIDAGELPSAFRRRVDEAVAAHPEAVRRARDAGLAIALGSDFSTPEQHGTNRVEFDELVRAGLSAGEALTAATRAGAELLAGVAAVGEPMPSGRIEAGEIADAVVLTVDPLEPGALGRADAVAAVVLGGDVVHRDTRSLVHLNGSV